jgi:hypothetical protein
MTVPSHILKFTISISLLGLVGCTKTFTNLYGIKDIKELDEKSILNYAKKYDIPSHDNFMLDTSYLNYLASLDKIKYKEQIKNHYQPLQALYYDREGGLRSFQTNCYASGFPNLKWDKDGIMATFPPKQQTPLDSLISFETLYKYIRPLTSTRKLSIDNYDFIVIVYWSKFMGRQSKRLIHYVQDNIKLARDKRIKIVYVNTDNMFARKAPDAANIEFAESLVAFNSKVY